MLTAALTDIMQGQSKVGLFGLFLYKDASEVGLGEVLAQDFPEGECPIFYLSYQLTRAERNCVTIEREALALKWAVEHFKYYLLDHTPLKWLHCMRETNPHLTQWHLSLQLYHFTIRNHKGCLYANAELFFR